MVPTTSAEQKPALPSEVLFLAEAQWLFSDEELLRTPSILDGMTPEKERDNRAKGVNFILQIGIMLKLPQITLATASVFLHRFYMRNSMEDGPGHKGLHFYPIAATCLFLATKVEENCRKMKELIMACVRVAQKDPNKIVDEQDREYWKWRDNILHNEDLLLEAICFDLSLEPPYRPLFELLLLFGQENNKPLRNAAWAFVNDSCLTILCLQFSSQTIAASALYAAAKHCNVTLPDDEYGRPWWEVAGVDLGSMRRACNILAEVYEPMQASRGRRSSIVYERTTEHGDEDSDRTRAPGVRLGGQPEPLNSPAPLSEPDVIGADATKRDREDDNVIAAVNGDVADHHKSNGAANKKQKTNGAMDHSNGTNGIDRRETRGLVSPKLDDVSEEGELEA